MDKIYLKNGDWMGHMEVSMADWPWLGVKNKPLFFTSMGRYFFMA